MQEQIDYKEALKAQQSWRSNPIFFSKQMFESNLWAKQEEVILSVRDNPRTSVKSGNTVGKSRIAAEIVEWFLFSHYPSKVIMTAPTFCQVEEILWKEIANLHRKATIPLGGELLNTELKLNEEWFALGISTDEVNRMQGFHSPYLLVILDEALGVDPVIWEAIEGLHPYRILAIGNPLEAAGKFYECFNSSLWNKITISCQECVDWQNKNGVIPGLVTQQWINERRDEWGAKSGLFQSRVLGEFPTEGTNLLIQPKWVDDARKRIIEEEENALHIVHSDVATKHGSNHTVIGYRIGHTQKELDMFQGIDSVMTAQKIKHKYEMNSGDVIVVDSDGFGEGISDILHNQKLGVTEFHGGYASKAMDATRFHNLRSQFYWVVAKKFEKGLYSLKDLPDKVYEMLKMQLCCIKTKSPDAQGRIQVETKEDLMSRGIASPDVADCFVYGEFGFWNGKMSELKPYSWR